jgi:hypothetical protein
MSNRGANSRNRRIGRPRFRENQDGRRNQIGFRTTAEIRSRLLTACSENGRSLAQEVEFRVLQSFWLEDLLKARLISIRVPARSHPAKETT